MVVVDDHRMFAESLARLLAEEGLDVVGTAASAAEAVTLVERSRPDVALVDYYLPDLDGGQLARRLLAGGSPIQVVILTGDADDRVLLDAIDAGCSGFLTKDRAAAEVCEAVRAVVGGESLVSPAVLARLLPKLTRGEDRPPAGLTPRESELLVLMTHGLTNRAIGERMFLSTNTVRNYVQSVLTKLGAHSKLEAVSVAVRRGIVDYPGE